MGRRKLTAALNVSMNGQDVGVLTRTAGGRLAFSYREAWLLSEQCRPISLSMPIRSGTYSGNVVENFFDNLLPDSQSIRNRIQTRFGAASNKSFDLLWQVGKDCVGALQLTHQDAVPDIRRVESRLLTDVEIAEILRHYRTRPLGMRPEEDFRISLAGAQEKTALLNFERKWHLPLGPTPTSHILKLPIGYNEHSGMDLSDSVENEWLCHLILKQYGISIADADIHEFDGVKVLVVERFDRRWAKDGSWLMRLPMEDMCQALNVPPALKYESDGGPGIPGIMNLLLGSTDALSDRHAFITVTFLFWLLAAIDGHAKNFSIFLRPGGDYCLTPLYDVISAHPLVANKQIDRHKLRMAMALQGKKKHYDWSNMLYRHWISTARNCRFPINDMDVMMSEVLGRMDAVIDEVSNHLPPSFPDWVAGPVFAGMRNARDHLARSKSQ